VDGGVPFAEGHDAGAMRVDGGVSFAEGHDAGTLRADGSVSFAEGHDAGTLRADGGVSFAERLDALQCVGTAPFFQRPATKRKCHFRHSPLAIRHSSFVIQKKSPPAFAGGLSKLGFDLWIIC